MAEDEQYSPETQQQITELLEERDGATAPAPTESGGEIGSNMVGGGTLSNPEVTDDKMGNPGGVGPKILDTHPQKPDEA